MPTVTAYPSCCGAQIFTDWGTNGGANNILALVKLLATIQDRRLTSVILNDTQCKDTVLLAAPARAGFVYTDRWINGVHESYCNSFHRCDTRVPLKDAPFEYPGMTQNTELGGNLPGGFDPSKGLVPIPPAYFYGYGPIDLDKPVEFEDGTPAEIVGPTFGVVPGRPHNHLSRAQFQTKGANGAFSMSVTPKSVEGRRYIGVGWYNLDTGLYYSQNRSHLAVRNVGTTSYKRTDTGEMVTPVPDRQLELEDIPIQRHENGWEEEKES